MFSTILSIVCLAVAAAWGIAAVDLVSSIRFMARLPKHANLAANSTDVTVVIAARNEQQSISETVNSLLQQTCLFRLIVVNDRSEDDTGAIIDRLAALHPQMTAIHIDRLPQGWLGKNHALFVGANQVQSEWILFTDADIRFEPTAVQQAVGYATEHHIDHLAVCPRMICRSFWLRVSVGAFILLLSIAIRPWRAADPRSKASFGIGAFNLVRRSTYERIGGHRSIAMRPDDDLKLGQRIKRQGFRQEAMIGTDSLTVEWYTSLKEMVKGLEKNILSPINYRYQLVFFPVLGLMALYVLPVAALFVRPNGLYTWVSVITIVVIWMMYALSAPLGGQNRWYALMAPIGAIILCFILIRSAFLIARDGGIRWRGTIYRVEDIRRRSH